MKKLTLILLLALIPSCHHLFSQDVNINPQILSDDLDVSKKLTVTVKATDKRTNRYTIGKRWQILGGPINNSQNVADIIKNKVERKLKNNGFKSGSDRIIEIKLTSLDYNTTMGFFTIGYNVECSMYVVIKDKNNVIKYSNPYREKIKKYSMFAPFASTNEMLINQVISQTIENILNDIDFVNALRKI